MRRPSVDHIATRAVGSDRAEGDRYLTPTMVVPPYAHVGCRIETTDGARAVVRYVGPVEGTDGEWVGVEWDDPTRGKHDGSHGGERYFECVASSANGATPGSFVRPHKIRPSVTFREAIATKYLDGKVPVQGAKSTGGDVGDDGTNEEGMFVKSSNGQKIEIQLCLKKEDPNAVLGTIDRVYLPDAAIHTAGEPGDASSCGLPSEQVQILDLAGNLFKDWSAVAAFGREFPSLVNLELTGVRAAWPACPPPEPSPFPNLSVLVMNRSGASWKEATAIVAACPALRELSLADCGISALGEGEGPVSGAAAAALSGLVALNLERNALEDWSEVERLALLPSLERLHLGGNKLRRVCYPETHAGGPVPFEQLKALLFADNAVDEWDSVDALNDFPSLAEVRLTGNPVTESAATRHEIVARVGRLSQLNGSLIADQERKDAEIRYLRRVLGLVKSAEGAAAGGEAEGAAAAARAPQRGTEAVQAMHPRLRALVDSYGELSTHAAKGPGTGKMGEDMLELTLVCVAASAGEKAPTKKKVPMTITVGKLKLLCEKLFKVKADAQQLYYKEPFMGMPELLEPDDYDIAYLGVKDGSSVLVEEKS